MARSIRWAAVGALTCVGFALGSHRATTGAHDDASMAEPFVLGTAYAAPAEVSWADTLLRGETISQLLERSRLQREEATALLTELQSFQNLRALRPGAVIRYRTSPTSGAVRGMEFQGDPDRMLRLRRDGSAWQGSAEEVPVHTDTAVLAGTVRSSLYDALLAGRGDVPRAERQQVADVMAERIFAWKIDFARDLREGDEYRVVLERMVRPDGTARSSRVLAVWLNLSGREHDAFLFRAPDGTEDYYAGDGESLRRAFLRAPLEFRRISSAFSTSRFHPVLKRARPHHGIDYAAAAGTPVRAVGDGLVVRAGWGGDYGNVVEIRHSRGYSSRYAHLRGFSEGARAGTRVRQGELVGYVGSTGLSTGPHLHYEFHSAGRPIDPNSIRYLLGDPVPGRYLAEFRRLVSARVAAAERAESAARLAQASASGDAGE
jgi:murein DD-endopeptidase MepM/ murein hydrolase activator NlpD